MKMKIIVKPRGQNKTEDLVAHLKKDNGLCLLVSSIQQQRFIEQSYPNLNGRIFAHPNKIVGAGFRGVLIDNIEEFLPALPLPIAGFSMTGDSE
jgi:hypothetical protein